MIRRPPRSTRTDTLFPTRRSSDLRRARLHRDPARDRAVEGAERAVADRIVRGIERDGAVQEGLLILRHPGPVPGSNASQSVTLADGWMPERVRHDEEPITFALHIKTEYTVWMATEHVQDRKSVVEGKRVKVSLDAGR